MCLVCRLGVSRHGRLVFVIDGHCCEQEHLTHSCYTTTTMPRALCITYSFCFAAEMKLADPNIQMLPCTHTLQAQVQMHMLLV